jgi:hypothetical protein
MNKDSWIALIIASIITIIVSIPLYYSQDYSHGLKGKLSEGSDTKVSEPMKRTDKISGSTTESESITRTDKISGSTTESELINGTDQISGSTTESTIR